MTLARLTRMNTAYAAARFTREREGCDSEESVFIRVHPWLKRLGDFLNIPPKNKLPFDPCGPNGDSLAGWQVLLEKRYRETVMT